MVAKVPPQSPEGYGFLVVMLFSGNGAFFTREIVLSPEDYGESVSAKYLGYVP